MCVYIFRNSSKKQKNAIKILSFINQDDIEENGIDSSRS